MQAQVTTGLLLGVLLGLTAPIAPAPAELAPPAPPATLERPPAPKPVAAAVAPVATETPAETALRVVEETFAAIDAAAEERDVETLIGLFTKLRTVRAAAEPAIRARIDAELQARTTGSCYSGPSLKLQLYINDGNRHLRALAGHVRRGEFLAAHARLKQVEAVFFDMRNEKRAVFHRNADALLKRARALYTRAISPPPTPR